MISLKTSVCLAICISATACVNLPRVQPVDNSQTENTETSATLTVLQPDDPLFEFLAEASAGEVSVVDDPWESTSVRVIAGRFYHAASGNLCREYQYQPAASEGTTSAALVCRKPDGTWYRVRVLVDTSG